MRNDPVLLIIGPSGAGKSTLAVLLQQRGHVRIWPTWTTRPRRPDERDTCPEHRFVTDAEFARLEADGFFVAAGRQPGLPYRYGLPHVEPDGPVRLVVGRAQLVAAVGPSALVYQLVADLPTLARRLATRGVAPAETAMRLADVRAEIRAGRTVSHRQFGGRCDPVDLCDAVAAALALDSPTHFSRPGAAA